MARPRKPYDSGKPETMTQRLRRLYGPKPPVDDLVITQDDAAKISAALRELTKGKKERFTNGAFDR